MYRQWSSRLGDVRARPGNIVLGYAWFPARGPLFITAAQAFVPGAVAAGGYVGGSVATDTFVAGAAEAEVHYGQ